MTSTPGQLSSVNSITSEALSANQTTSVSSDPLNGTVEKTILTTFHGIIANSTQEASLLSAQINSSAILRAGVDSSGIASTLRNATRNLSPVGITTVGPLEALHISVPWNVTLESTSSLISWNVNQTMMTTTKICNVNTTSYAAGYDITPIVTRCNVLILAQ